MNRIGFIVICVTVVLGGLMIGCTPLQVSPTETPIPPTPSIAPMPVAVSPFYDFESNQINVGTYSEQLNTSDPGELAAVAEEMAGQKQALTPEQMFVLSIKLFDLGDNNNAVYWFYEAQFRAKLFQIAIDPLELARIGDPSLELPAAYGVFTQVSGEYINGYAGCDIENWINITKMVRDNNPEPPDLDAIFPEVTFVESSQWQSLNDEVADGLDQFINYLSNNQEAVKQQRQANNADAQYCK